MLRPTHPKGAGLGSEEELKAGGGRTVPQHLKGEKNREPASGKLRANKVSEEPVLKMIAGGIHMAARTV